MISDVQLRELLAQKSETKNLDYKESFNWDTAGNDAKCELVKDILAFLNTQDGGLIVLGVQDGTLQPTGLGEADFISFDATKVNDFLQRYTDPQSFCEVQKLIVDGLRFVLVSVPEFKDVPIICKKAANSSKDSSKTILKLGGLYIRTEKATSVIVPSAEEMRDLMNRALLKRGDQLLSTIQALLKGTPVSQESEIEKYDEEIRTAREYFREVLPPNFEDSGYWELVAMPQTYGRERIPNITTVFKFLSESDVHLRGWNFPHLDRDTSANFANGRQSYTQFRHHIEANRAYQSGLFIWRGAYWGNRKEHEYALSFVNVIYTVTEFYVFLKRYYERVSLDAAIKVSIELTHLKDRTLTESDSSSWSLLGSYVAKVLSLRIEQEYILPELRASAEELAIKTVQKIFEVFNWNNPDANMIRGWQQKLLSRTF